MTINYATDNMTFHGQPVLVTGAAGFIGSALCRALLRYGFEVHGTSRARHEHSEIRWWQADLSQPETIARVLRQVQPTVVFHLASHVSGDRARSIVLPTMRDNLITTVNLLTAASEGHGPRVVLAGSMEEPDLHDHLGPPGSPYAAAKVAAWTYGRLFHALYGLPVIHLRVFMVYGPGQRDTTKLVPYVTTSLLRGEAPRLTSGSREVDWVYVDDVAAAFVAAAMTPRVDGKSLDVGSGRLIAVRSVVDQIAHLAGGQASPQFGALDDRPLEHQRAADVDRTQELIGWWPRTSLAAGLERTVQWFREYAV